MGWQVLYGQHYLFLVQQNLFLVSVSVVGRDSQRNEVIPSDCKRLQATASDWRILHGSVAVHLIGQLASPVV